MKEQTSPMKTNFVTKARCLRRNQFLVFLLTLWTLSVANAYAQSATATLSGTVTDERNAVVAGATVSAVNDATSLTRKATTNSDGYFTLPLLPPGNYTLRIEGQGFAILEKRDVILNVGDQRSLLIQLRVSGVAAEVSVTSNASLVDETATIKTTVDRQFAENLPLNGRSFQSLITLTPGVVLTPAGSGAQASPGQFSVNGQRANTNYFTVDGVSANIGITAVSAGFGNSATGAVPGLSASGGTNSLVSIEALQEFKIQTSTYAPEFGRSPGAQVQIVTRGGTNQFSGSVFDYVRNDKFDANDFFANRGGLPRPKLRQNDFGGVIGGPVFFPAFGEGGPVIYDGRNRTFFFFSYEGLRLTQPQALETSVPSIAARNAAPALLRPYLNAYPLPTGADIRNSAGQLTGAAILSASYSNDSLLDATSFRLDHNFNSRFTVFGRYNYSPSSAGQRGLSPFAAPATLSTNGLIETEISTLTFGSTQVLTSRASNEARFNYSVSRGKTSYNLDDFGGATVPSVAALFPSFASPATGYIYFSPVTVPLLVSGSDSESKLRQLNFVDNFSLVAGAHTIKLGADFRRIKSIANNQGGEFYTQFLNFTGLGFPTATAPTPPVGTVLSGIVGNTGPNLTSRFPLLFYNFSAYAQDTWRATRALTLTYGVRWEVNPPGRGADGLQLYTLDQTDNYATALIAPAGTPFFKTTYNNFAPRVGAAYQLFQKPGRETVVRGGFGVFYDTGLGRGGLSANTFPFGRQRRTFNVPFALSGIAVDPLPPVNLSNPYPVGEIFVYERNLKLPYTLQFNLAVEQSLGSNQSISVAYIGARGRRQLRGERLDLVNPRFIGLAVTRNASESEYDALQAQFTRRLSRGLQILASYTWSHSIDNISNDAFPNNTPTFVSNADVDRGNSDFDIRHAFNLAATYNIPTPNLGKFGNAVFRGFSLDAIFTARSAPPVDLIGLTVNNPFTVRVRPDYVAGQPLYLDDPNAPGGKRLNPAAFAAPPTGTGGTFVRQGTFGRNVVRGFSLYQTDLALRRQFNFTERLKLQLRVEAFNVFNRANFAPQINNITNAQFGRSTQMYGRGLGSGGGPTGGFSPLYQVGGPRSLQLAVKFLF